MKRLALLILCLSTIVPALHASPVNPLGDGFTFTVDNTVLTNTNASFSALTGKLTFSDSTSTFTFAEASANPLLNALSVTRTCVTLNAQGCSTSIVSVSNANALNDTLTASLLVGVTLQASAQAGVSNLVFASTNASVGAESALVGYQAPAATPEPSSLALLGTGILGVAGTMRRRFTLK